MNPERSLVRIARLPIARANSSAALTVDVGGLQRDDDLDQLHHRHRREEVQPDHSVGAFGPRRQLGDRDRRRVGGQEARVRQLAVQPLEQLALRSRVLGDRLDHGLRPGQILEPRGVGHARGLGIGVLAGDPLPTHRALQRPREHLARVLERWLGGLIQDDALASRRRRLRDPGAHESGTDDADHGHIHRTLLRSV